MRLLFFSLFILTVSQANAQTQYQSMNKRASEISLLYFQDETEDMVRIQPIYSKARGVTVLSAINNVNNRALRKLKIEAAMLGADGVYITNNYQKGVQFMAPVQVTYSAIAYRDDQLTAEGIKALYTANSYRARSRVTYNRNLFSERIKFLTDHNQELNITNLTEERGHVWAELNINNKIQRYRVVKANDNQITLSRYVKNDKVIENIEFINAALTKK